MRACATHSQEGAELPVSPFLSQMGNEEKLTQLFP